MAAMVRISPSEIRDPQVIQSKIAHCERKAQDAKITAIVLAMITLILFAISFVLFGVGTLPATTLSGLGMFYYLGGVFLSFLGLGLLGGGTVCGTLYGIRSHQKDQWIAQYADALSLRP